MRKQTTIVVIGALRVNLLFPQSKMEILFSKICMLCAYACFMSFADIFQNYNLLQKYLSEIPTECQTVWIQTV